MTHPTEDLIRGFYRDVLGAGRLVALSDYVAATYAPHLPVFAACEPLTPGIEALRGRLAAVGPVANDPAHVVVDGELAFVHVLYDGVPPVAGVDLLRLDVSGRIAEHWNIRQPISHGDADPRARLADALEPDARFPFDATWVRNRVATMLRELWAGGRAELVPEFYSSAYIQHNPDMPGGYERIEQVVRNDIRGYMRRTAGQFPINVHHLGAQGDIACVHLSIFMAGINRNDGARSTNVDLFRLDRQGRMIEHWDVLQIDGIALPASATLF